MRLSNPKVSFLVLSALGFTLAACTEADNLVGANVANTAGAAGSAGADGNRGGSGGANSGGGGEKPITGDEELVVTLQGSAVIAAGASARVRLYGFDANVADASATVIAETTSPVSELPANVTLELPDDPASLIEPSSGREGNDRYYLSVIVHQQGSGYQCAGDLLPTDAYYDGPSATSPLTVPTTVPLEATTVSEPGCSGAELLTVRLEGDETIESGATARVRLYGFDANVADAAATVIAETTTPVSELPANVTLELPDDPASLIEPSSAQEGNDRYYLSIVVYQQGSGYYCAGDLIPTDAYFELPSATSASSVPTTVPLRVTTVSEQGCST